MTNIFAWKKENEMDEQIFIGTLENMIQIINTELKEK